ncbi:MAG: winged helix DNA-binding protein [Planctomycetes bacterium]|nr:winged helix DNA-binding protein [Planctomycetota bacterium]
MNQRLVKDLLDACHLARKALQMLPPLPEGVVPRHAHVMDAIHQLVKEKDAVYVSDVGTVMKSTAPSITKLITELEALGYVRKASVPGDRRFVAISLTEKGEEFHSRYVDSYHAALAAALGDIRDGECRTAIRVLETLSEHVQAVTNGFFERM